MFKSISRWVIIIIAGLAIGMGIGYIQAQFEIKAGIASTAENAEGGEATSATITKAAKSTPNGSSDIGGPFSLTNHKGEAVTEQDYADQYKIVFFGFTYCPAVCPTELQKVASILDQLGDKAQAIAPIFITVDPDRDDAKTMKDYIEQFHEDLIGLTGTQEQIDAVTKQYRIYASKVENDMMDGYMMDHSAYLYFMTPDDKMISLYPSQDTAEAIAKDIAQHL